MENNFKAKCETFKHIKRVNELLIRFSQELLNRAIEHDLSKLEPPEAELFESITEKLSTVKFDSPEYHDGLKQLGPALEHHYANNSHHPQHYKGGIKDMNLFDICEMLLDWKASAERQNGGNINMSLEKNQERFGYSDELKAILKNTLPFLVGF